MNQNHCEHIRNPSGTRQEYTRTGRHDGFWTWTHDQMFQHKHRTVTKHLKRHKPSGWNIKKRSAWTLRWFSGLCRLSSRVSGEHFSVAPHFSFSCEEGGHLLNICWDFFCVCVININFFWASTDGFQFNIEYDRVHQRSEISTRFN